MDVLPILDRCIRAEQCAAAVYDRLEERFHGDPGLGPLWGELADEERRHARNLMTWRDLLRREPPDRRAVAIGFEPPLEDLEHTLSLAVARADLASTPDEALAIALDIESCELDEMYVQLFRCSPLCRDPDIALARQHELDVHHRSLVCAVRAHARDEALQARADLLEFTE